ncbi:putative Uncharacterized phosphatase [Glarea lozoyensis 74030]|uniref:Putative Uncharacterized phosphatase n=1 Tax=Glarea lozoyensis (strain ATCC 74030 / MF5533) TaxID=1104152 RepID=H0ENS6_GLAL7|nr:putative Uncharacterized phosphatase [Glarea lozoyensis 74030]
MSTPSPLPALKTSPKFIFFTDFDGTITQQDSNDFLVNTYGLGPTRRKELFQDVLFGRTSFRDAFKTMLDSVQLPLDHLDEGFKEFYEWARANNVPVVVLSGGMEPLIRALLGHLLGVEEGRGLVIMSNGVKAREGMEVGEEGGWEIEYRDESAFGHDKSRQIRPYAELPDGKRPVLFYAGDGVSDLSAARETDLLFAKAGHDLVTYCQNEKVPFTTFQNFNEILETVKSIVSGETDVAEVMKNQI